MYPDFIKICIWQANKNYIEFFPCLSTPTRYCIHTLPIKRVGIDLKFQQWSKTERALRIHFLPNQTNLRSLISSTLSFLTLFFFVFSLNRSPMNSTSPRRSQNQNQTLLPSPPHKTTHSSNSNSSSSSNTNGNAIHNNNNNTHQQLPPLSPTTTPKPTTTRSESTPTLYPTTFVQADSTMFKHVVQMLTGSSETSRQATSAYCNSSSITTKPINYNPTSSENINIGLPSKNSHMIPPIKTMPTKPNHHQSGYRLYQRRNNLNINPLRPSPLFSSNPSSSGFSPRNHADVVSPSILDFPSLVLSPVTPLLPDPFGRSGPGVATGYHYYGGNGSPNLDTVAEEKAIKEKGFFLHPSPRATTPRDTEPRLLPLFPTTSPKAGGAESSSSWIICFFFFFL